MSKSMQDRVRVALPGEDGPHIITRPIPRLKAYAHVERMLYSHPVVYIMKDGAIDERIKA